MDHSPNKGSGVGGFWDIGGELEYGYCWRVLRVGRGICRVVIGIEDDHNLWDIIVDGDLQEEVAPRGEQSGPPAPKTTKQLTAKRNQERVKSILLLAIPDEYLLQVPISSDAKSLWAAIKSRFGGNDESKKMQRNVLKHHFENFTNAPNESLDKAYDRQPSPQLENEDFQQINEDDLEELDLRWHVAMLTALVAQDGLGGYDWSNDFEVEPVNYALMTISFSSSLSSSDNEGYELALESLESRILVHEKNELAWGEKYEFQNYKLKCREIKINNLNLELEKVVKERDELKLKIEKWEESSKNLDELLNSQMSARDKTGLGYGTQLNEMSNNSETDSEISLSVFDVRSSDEENTPANDRFSKADGFHVFPTYNRGNFLTPRADISFAGLDEYAIRKKIIESKTTEINTDTRQSKSIQIMQWAIQRSDFSYFLVLPGKFGAARQKFMLSIHHALTINATIDSKAVVVTEASIRSSLLFNDADDSKDSLEGTNGNKGDQVQTPHDSPLLGGHTSDRAEGALNLQELSVTNLSNRVLALESIKDAHAAEISALKSRIKKLEKSTVFDDQDADHGMEYMETEEAVDEGRQSGETEEVKLTDDTEVVEDKSSGDKGGNAEELVSTARPEVSTARPDIDAARQEDSTMKEEKAKEKGVSIKDVDDSSRPTRSILTLNPLTTIDPKDKGKGVLKESPVKKVKRSDMDVAQIAKDTEIARLMDASKELATRLQMKEREMYTIEERSKLLAEFFKRRKKLLAKERAATVRNTPPTRTQLRSLMMTYLKHTGKYRHNQLNKKTFEEIHALHIKEQERDADSMPIGSERDEKMIDKMNKKVVGMDEEEVPEEPESTKVEVKQEGHKENIRKRSGRRLKMKAYQKSKRQKTDSELKKESIIRGMTLDMMMELRLIAESEGEAVFYLLRFIQKHIDDVITMTHRHQEQAIPDIQSGLYGKELASPRQTALGKDISNPLIVGSLLKTICVSHAPCNTMKPLPRSKQSGKLNRRDLPRDNPLVSVEILRCDIKRSKSENKGIVPTEMELVLEQTQQDSRHGPSDASLATQGLSTDSCFISHRDSRISIDLLTPS
ncbi:hypothetical protein Tco_0017154 [Tanacetum coccineum]